MAGDIAVVGTGLVGTGWAIVFARAGRRVRLWDGVEGAAEKSRKIAGDRLKDLEAIGLIEDAAGALARISVAPTLAAAVDGVDYVQESTFERTDVKREVFSALDKVVGPDTVIGSSSSGIAASKYTDHVACRARCLVSHPVNPPYLVPVVELVPAPWTDPAAVEKTRALMASVGQKPVVLSREIEGFVINRLQGVLLMEIWKLYEEGIASIADLDATVSDGLGLRWSFMGPFETIDLNAPGGIADYSARLSQLYTNIAASRSDHKPWPKELVAKAEAERRKVLPEKKLPERGEWRDRRLMALNKHKADADRDIGE